VPVTLRHKLGFSFVLLACVFATGCFSIEQEVFLNRDGSGEMVIFISIPDFPEDVASQSPGTGAKPEDKLAEMKNDLTKGVPPTVKLREVKEVKQNGARGFYVVLEFKQLKDLESALANFGNQSLSDEKSKPPSATWTLQSETREGRTSFLQKFYMDVIEADKKAEEAKPGEEKPKDDFSKQLEEQLKPVIYSMVKMRFVLHAPSPIRESNADIVLNKNTAVWNCSMSAFLKNKMPIEMKASF
jgi:hypothetical protein